MRVAARLAYLLRSEQASPSSLAFWVNETSFWPDLDSFHRLLADHGYAVTLAREPWYAPDRTFFLALPAAGSEAG